VRPSTGVLLEFLSIMFWQIVLLVVLLGCSGVVSGSETALFGLSASDLNAFRESKRPLRRRAQRLMDDPRRVLLTVLIANTSINVFIFAVSAVLVARFGAAHPLLATLGGVVVLIAVIVVGEVGPKAAALAAPVKLAPAAATVVHALQTVSQPVRWILDRAVIEPMIRLLSPPDARPENLSTDELRKLVEASAKRGTFSSVENEMLQAVVALPEVRVRSIMVPRVDIQAVGLHEPVEAVRSRLAETRLTKLPVYRSDLDDIAGVIFARDLYLNPEKRWVELLRPARYVPEQINLLQLLEHFRQYGHQLAVVVDEYGGTAGIVAMEDVLEQIVGDLQETGEAPADAPIEVIDADTYRLAGDLNVREWASHFGIGQVDSRIDTLGGLVLTILSRAAREGDTVRIGNLTLTVETLRGQRIDRIILRRQAGAGISPVGDSIRGAAS